MSDPRHSRMPPVPPLPKQVVVLNLEPRLAAAPSATLLRQIPWAGPRVDPATMRARDVLAWLR